MPPSNPRPLTLPIDPLPAVAMDYARLRAEGLRLLASFAGDQWTDHNSHDPGITVLEQLCYAITDLGYRTAYPIPDLLAGTSALGLFEPHTIFTGDPVTRADLRKAILDVDGIANAWVDPRARPEIAFYHRAGSRELHLRPDPGEPDATPVALLGLLEASLQTSDTAVGGATLRAVAARLHRSRALGEDVALVTRGRFPIWMEAKIEIAAVDDPIELLADIVERIDDHLAPTARFQAIARAREQRRTLDEIYEGPALEHGFVDDLEDPPPVVYVSDLLHIVLDTPAARAVRSLELATSPASPRERWALDVPPGHTAVLAADAKLRLFRDGLEIPVDAAAVRTRVEERRRERGAVLAKDEPPIAEPPRPRALRAHSSIQHQLPAAYGVGALGLSPSETPERRARAAQLEGYLLLFDQLLSNAFAQLAHARNLLSPDESARTYWAEPVVDPELRLDRLILQDATTHRAWLDAVIEPSEPHERQKRFLAHLLARFAEQLGDHSFVGGAYTTGAPDRDRALVSERRAFLKAYPRVSGARGSGLHVLRDPSDDAPSGFEERLRHKLGFDTHPPFTVVEHVLLRPIEADAAQLAEEGEPEVPLLAGVAGPDPWSLQLTFVVRGTGVTADGAKSPYARLVEQTLLAETPAHLTFRLLWLEDDATADWSAFVLAWTDFRRLYRDYRTFALDGRLPEGLADDDETAKTLLHLQVRDARDRVVDLLDIGRPFPLRDLPVKSRVIVAPGTPTRIPVGFSQRDAFYELRHAETGAPIEIDRVAVVVDGTGGPIEIPTPPIQDDVSYRILAVKREGANDPARRREAWLRTTVRLEESVDPTLTVQIRLPLLDPRVDRPSPRDARIGDHGVRAEVEVLASQEGVVYELIEHRDPIGEFPTHRVISEAAVTGTSGAILLQTIPMNEDIDIRVRGSKAVGTPPQTRTAVLDLVLPLRVRADRALDVQLLLDVVDYGAGSALRVLETQESAKYRLFQHRVRDREFVFDDPPTVATVDVRVGARTVRIERPPSSHPWADLPEFEPLGDAIEGNGGTLEIELATRTADALLLVQAEKEHRSGPLGSSTEVIASAVQLERARALLVCPNHDQPLRLLVELDRDHTTGPVVVQNGEPGVFYELRLDGETDLRDRPAYFHQRDDADARLNKGLDQLRVEVDFVVTRGRPAGDAATTAPMAPLLDAGELEAGAIVQVSARRAMTGLEAELTLPALVEAVPAVTVEPPEIAAGASAMVVIEASRSGEQYRLLRSGTPLGRPLEGDGGRLQFSTGALRATTRFTISATAVTAASLVVERRVDVVVKVG